MSEYTAITFAPVQGFIEKSRKLRDLYGASFILSFLSAAIVQAAKKKGLTVISPGEMNVTKGMPNRILVGGRFERNDVEKVLLNEWKKILRVCRQWIEESIPEYQYFWSQSEDQIGQHKGEWEKWESHTWEIFVGYGGSVQQAMDDLETRKLKRDWVGINWVGESSSLTGTDAIAWPQLGKLNSTPGRQLSPQEKREQAAFYRRLSEILESSQDGEPQGKYLDPNERLSIPELVKRLVTHYDLIGKKLSPDFKIKNFSEMIRLPEPDRPGHWTGWFMGDGDKVGDKLKDLAKDPNNVQPLTDFSEAMREWGRNFQKDFPPDLGRVVYSGGDDFLGAIYSKKPNEPIPPSRALDWLMTFNDKWKEHGQDITVSVGFVWAGHSVPQRDILQHCREAEKRAKSLGRDRVTIRVVFNSGQFVQWTCPWDYLDILTKYRDREGKTRKEANWSHIYTDWAELKGRHAIVLKDATDNVGDEIALSLFDIYFGDRENFESRYSEIFTNNTDTPLNVIRWIDGLINVGWKLCSNT